MKKFGSRGLRFGLIALMILVSVLAVVTLTACQDKLTVAELSVVEDSVPDVIVAGDFNISDIKLMVTTDEGENVEIAAETSMLTAEGREALSTPGNKKVTLFYQGKTVVVEVLVVEQGTETVTVIFLDANGKQLAKKSAVKGGSINAPTAPEVDNKVFVAWVNAAGQEVDLNAVEADITVKASYSENATKHTVKFFDYTNKLISEVTVNHGDKISQPGWTKPSIIDSFSWGVDFNTYTVTNNQDFHMTVTYKEATVQYYYAFSSQPTVKYALNIFERVVIGGAITKKTEAESLLRTRGFNLLSWQNDISNVQTDTEMVATVSDRTFTISFKNGDHESETLLTGTVYSLPTTAKPMVGHTFNNKWKGSDGVTYSGTLTVNKDLVLEPVYNKKISPVKVTYDFEGLTVGGNPVTETITDNATSFGDLISLTYIQNKFNTSVKNKSVDYADYEIESVTFNAVDVTSSGVTLGEVSGNDTNDFTVKLINKNTGTAGLQFTEGKVTGYDGTSTIIYIPAKNGTFDVTEIGDEVFMGKTIISISIPETVEKLGDRVFKGAVLGSDIVLPVIKTMGVAVFEDAVTSFIDGTDPDQGRISVSVAFGSAEGAITKLPDNTFSGSKGITAVTLPDAVTVIGDEAFAGSEVATVTGLNRVTEIGDYAFMGNNGITSLDLPKVKKIGDFAFLCMPRLTALTLATESEYEQAEAKLVFDVKSILISDNIVTLTLGEGVERISCDIETYLNNNAEMAAGIAGLMAQEGINTYVSSSLTTINLPKGLVAINNVDDPSDPYGIFANLVGLKAINVASGGEHFASDNGVLYAFIEDNTLLVSYPCGRVGDYAMPVKVGGRDVNGIFTNFAGVSINTFTANDACVQALIAVEGNTGISGSKTINNVVINGSVLGDAVVQNINYLRAGFPIVLNYYISGTVANLDTIIEEQGWTDVFAYDANSVSKYDAASGLTYSITDGKATVLSGDKTASVITVPAKLNGADVVAIADNAFKNYTNLVTLNVLATLKSFGNALTGDTALKNITVAGWTDDAVVDADIFNGTAWATSNNLLVLGGKLIKYNNFPADEVTGITTVITAEDLAGVKEIPDEFFKDMNNLTAITLSASVKIIGDNAFNGSGLKTIDFGSANNVGIGEAAFKGSALTSISLTAVLGVGANAFENCAALKTATITCAINNGYLSVAMFKGCSALESVVLDNIIGLTKDNNGNSNAFEGCSSLQNVDFIATFTEIPGQAFKGCSAIKSIDFTKYAVSNIGTQAFDSCTGLEAIVLGSGVKSVGTTAFYSCSALQSIRIVGDGGILQSTVPDTAFPNPSGTYTIYVSASADTTKIAYYADRIKTVLPTVSFAFYPGYEAGNNALNKNAEDTIYIDEAPVYPEFDGFVFNSWYTYDGVEYDKASFPMSVTANFTLYAKYFSVDKGSLIDADLTYDAEKKEYALTSYAGTTDEVVFIPAEYNGADGLHPITTVYIGAFHGCAVTELILPEGVTLIKAGTSADSSVRATQLTYVYIPSTVTEIEDGAFALATDLDIEFGPASMLVTVTKAAFTDTKWYTEEAAEAHEGGNNGFVIAGRMAIEYLGGAKQVTLPSDLYKIGEGLFQNNAVIEEIVINDDLVFIGDNAFTNATKLAYVTYAAGSRGNETSKIAYVNVASFTGTQWLAAQDRMAIVGTILIKYNGFSGDKTVNIPDYVTVINAASFKNNGTVTSVVFGTNSKLKEIGDEAFYNTQIVSVSLPAVDKMGVSVFENSAKLKAADLSNVALTKLPDYTFSGCALLETVTLPDAMTSFGEGAFDDCASLTSITAIGFNDTLAFFNSGIIEANCPFYNVEAGVIDKFVVLGKVLVKFVASTAEVGAEGKSVVIPDGVEIIYNNVFAGTSITTVTIPASVKVIQQNAFYSVSTLKTVVFGGNGLEEIGNMAFYKCALLDTIVLPTTLVKIGSQAFEETAVKNVVIPDSVKEIGQKAFFNTAMETLEIGSGLNKLGNMAFGENGVLYKVTISWNNAGLDALNTNIASSLETDNAENFALFVTNLLKRDLTSKIRVYAESALYNYVTTAAVDNYKVRSWNNDVAEFFTKGTYPQVSFDNDGYFMNTIRTEVITEIGEPIKTGHTFMGWYRSYNEANKEYSDPLVLPYRVNADIKLYAKWFKNALANSAGSTELSFLAKDGGNYYVVSAVNQTVEKPIVKLYVNSSVENKAVRSFEMSASVTGIKTVVLTNASAFGVPADNIFRYFTDLTSVELLSDDYDASAMKLSDGVLYSADGTILIAYLYRTVTNENNEKVKATTFVVPDTVTTILPYAFANSGLTEITVGKNVTSIGHDAFNDSLTSLKFAAGIRLVDADKESFANTAWFAGAKTAYTVNNAIAGFFYAAGNILVGYDQEAQTNDLVIPTAIDDINITVIASNINMSGSAISFSKMVLPEFVEKINSNAFADIDVITDISIGGTSTKYALTDVADDVFSSTAYYKNNYDGMLIIGNVLLKCVNAEEIITVPDYIVAISKEAFFGSQVKRVVLSSNLTYIGESAFYSCPNLTEIEIPNNVTTIADKAFAICASLTSVSFNVQNSKLKTIGNNAFESCQSLLSVSLPINLDKVGNSAFKDCAKLATVNFDYIVEEENNGVITQRVVAKSNLNEIGEYAFFGCSKLSSISIPNNLTAIKVSTFENCVALDKVVFDVARSAITSIESRAFAGCTALGSTVDITKPNLVTLVLPSALVSIGDSVFDSCAGLLGVRMQYNVATIGAGIFKGCNRLAKVEIYGSTPASIQSDSFERSVRIDESTTTTPIYQLRIYVLNTQNQTLKTVYKTAWANYANNIYELREVPTLRYTDGVNKVEIKTDIVVNPSCTFNNTNYTNWTYSSFATIKSDGTEDYNEDVRKSQNVTTGANALVQGTSPIVVVDYDLITLQRVA